MNELTEPQRTNWMLDKPCPDCGNVAVATNGTHEWCCEPWCGYDTRRGEA